MNKTCFKCGSHKPLTEFYPHAKMADGYLNKCKDCTKKDTAERHSRMMADPIWREKELERHRLKSARQRNNKVVCRCESTRERSRKYRKNNKQKVQAHNKKSRAQKKGIIHKKPCEVCGSTNQIHGHHDDYSKPLDVIWLCPKHHGERHVQINRARRLQQA